MGDTAIDSKWESDHLVATLAAHRVIARDGRVVRLRTVWGAQPAVQVFLRQFGCLFCHQMVAEILAASAKIAARGGHVALVGCGTLEQGLKFAREKGIPREGVELYVDPGRESYRAASLERSYGRTFFHTASRSAYTGARRQGHRITGIAGDVAQLGGVLVIAPPAQLVYLHRSRFAGDHPSVPAIVDAVSAA